ncbi:hypothetical protein ACHAWO_011310 [Cyclotella atomus]|uniref:Uncharacterized protein n=1 Tax=Cyclotella atomus TaxID=382360 RepID=A0ABD3N1D9_9STRA
MPLHLQQLPQQNSNNSQQQSVSQHSSKSRKNKDTQSQNSNSKKSEKSDETKNPNSQNSSDRSESKKSRDPTEKSEHPMNLMEGALSQMAWIASMSNQPKSRQDDVSEVSGSHKNDELDKAMKRIERLEPELHEARQANRGGSPRDHNFSHLYDRVPVDLAPLDISIDGIQMTTSPVIFKPGDSTWWKFSGDMMRLVEILEVTPPTPIHGQPNYFIRCENGQTHSVSRSKLFLSKERACQIDLDGRITSDPGLFTATDRMDLYVICSQLSKPSNGKLLMNSRDEVTTSSDEDYKPKKKKKVIIRIKSSETDYSTDDEDDDESTVVVQENPLTYLAVGVYLIAGTFMEKQKRDDYGYIMSCLTSGLLLAGSSIAGVCLHTPLGKLACGSDDGTNKSLMVFNTSFAFIAVGIYYMLGLSLLVSPLLTKSPNDLSQQEIAVQVFMSLFGFVLSMMEGYRILFIHYHFHAEEEVPPGGRNTVIERV